MSAARRVARKYAALRQGDTDGSYMSVQSLRSLHDHSALLLQTIHSGTRLPDWVESKIDRASAQILDVFEFIQHGELEEGEFERAEL
jgi:hypothetical protein